MKIPTVAFLLLISSTTYATDEHISLPTDVSSFVEKRDLCDHFRGEDPYDEERRAFLEKNMLKLCTGTDAALAKLKSKYINNKLVTSKLNQYEEKIEASSLK